MDENGIDGCLGINDSFRRFVDDLLTVFAREESGISSIRGGIYKSRLLGNDIVPLRPIGILTRLKSSLEL